LPAPAHFVYRNIDKSIDEEYKKSDMIIECPECGAKNQTLQPPQDGKRYRCGKCGAEIILLQNTDTHAGFPPKLARPKPTTLIAENTSGQGKLASVPREIQGWNWGAFLLNWLWSVDNRVWIGLLCLIPYVGIIMNIVLGVKGNEWAWQNKKWESIEHFKRTQSTWAK